MSMPRRESTSSGDTIIYESVERRGNIARSSKPCPQCEKLLLEALKSPFPVAYFEESSDGESSDEDGGLTTWSEKSKSKPNFWYDEPLGVTSKEILYPRTFSGVQDLQAYARKCPVCRLLWQMLRGADDTLLDQVLKYGNDEFNATSLYLPDGGTDIEELTNPGPKVKLTASAILKYPGLPQPQPQPPPSHPSSRKRRFTRRAAAIRISSDVRPIQSLEHPRRYQRRVRIYSTPSLRLQLAVVCKAQPGSRKSTTTTVEEDLTVFWFSGT
jgi:hypothetical protein